MIDRDRAFELALAALWLTIQLGAAGFRARRGAGGARAATAVPGWPADLPPLDGRAQTPGELVEHLAQDLGLLRRFVGWDSVEHVSVPTSFGLLHPDSFLLFVLDRTFPSWWEALDAAGQAFRSFRQRQPDDYHGIKSILAGGRATLSTVKRSIFGLPLPFFFSSLFKSLTAQGVPSFEARARASATVMPQGADRSASPLFFKVMPLAGDEPRYGLLLGSWRSRLTPQGMLVVRPRDRALRPVTIPAPADYSYVDEWFGYLGQNVAPLLPVAYA